MTTKQALKIAVKNVIGFKGVKQVKLLAGPARGVTMMLDFTGGTPMYLGMYEWELHRFLRETLPSARRVFDVGGSIGYDALLLAANNAGLIYTFEPNTEDARTLQANVDLNPRFVERIRVRIEAVGREEAEGMTTLDSLSAELGAPDFVKIDIDGGELDALLGGERTLRESRPHLVVETHSRELEEQCGELLVRCGYRPVIKHNRRVWREYRAGAPHNRWLLAAGAPSRG